jgi:hypothetical protein
LLEKHFFYIFPSLFNNPVNCAALKRKTHRAAISNNKNVVSDPVPAFRLKPSSIVRNIKRTTCSDKEYRWPGIITINNY